MKIFVKDTEEVRPTHSFLSVMQVRFINSRGLGSFVNLDVNSDTCNTSLEPDINSQREIKLQITTGLTVPSAVITSKS